MVTRSGANELHFSLYEFLRNDKLNANDWFANNAGQPEPPFKFNQFGGTAAGPVVIPRLYNGKNRTFFFGNAELVRFVQAMTFTGSVPLAEQLAGDFTRARNAAGTPLVIYDPLTTRANPAGAGFLRAAYDGNRIPAARFDPVARNLSRFFPAPNAPGNPITGVNNYSRTDGNFVRKDTLSLRADHHFSERNRLFARFSYDDTPFTRAAPYGRDNPASPGTGPQVFSRRNSIVEDTHTFSPTLLGTFRYSHTRLSNFRKPFSFGFNVASLGFPAGFASQIDPPAFPNIGITGLSVTGSNPTGLNQPTGSSLGPATLLGQNIAFFDRATRVPYSEQWNFNVQRELPGAVLLEIGYAGSHGLKFSTDRILNQLPDAALALRDGLRAQVPNPFFGQVQVGALGQRTVARAQLLRPFPHFEAVTNSLAGWASSIYHALEAKVEKRYARGFTVLGAYTYSKLIDYATGPFAGEDLGGGGFQNWNNLRADRSASSLDQTHRFIVNTVYEIPFGKNLRGPAGKLAAGWEIGAILLGFSGGPLGLSSAVNNTFSQGGGQRPNWTGASPRLSNPAPARWFDITQFSNPLAYTFGNAGRTFSGSRSDGFSQLDFILGKSTALTEKVRLQFRAEFFNLTNTPRFGPPNVNFGNPQFGVVSAQGNLPRIIQFALKLIG